MKIFKVAAGASALTALSQGAPLSSCEVAVINNGLPTSCLPFQEKTATQSPVPADLDDLVTGIIEHENDATKVLVALDDLVEEEEEEEGNSFLGTLEAIALAPFKGAWYVSKYAHIAATVLFGRIF